MALDLCVSLTPEQAADVVHHAVVDGSITGELIDHYAVQGAPVAAESFEHVRPSMVILFVILACQH